MSPELSLDVQSDTGGHGISPGSAGNVQAFQGLRVPPATILQDFFPVRIYPKSPPFRMSSDAPVLLAWHNAELAFRVNCLHVLLHFVPRPHVRRGVCSIPTPGPSDLAPATLFGREHPAVALDPQYLGPLAAGRDDSGTPLNAVSRPQIIF